MRNNNAPTHNRIFSPRLKKIGFTLLTLILGLCLIPVVTFFAIPAQLIETWTIEGVRKKSGIILVSDGFQRLFPFGFASTGLTLHQSEGDAPLFTFDTFEGHLHPLNLFAGQVKITTVGKAGAGIVEGEAVLTRKGMVAHLRGNLIEIHAPPAQIVQGHATLGSVVADTTLTFGKKEKCPTGTLSARVDEITARDFTVMGFPPPLNSIDEVVLNGTVQDCHVMIENTWLESRPLSARLKGRITLHAPLMKSRIEATLDLTPREELLQDKLLSALLGRYRKSANFYSLPVRGTLGAPLIL